MAHLTATLLFGIFATSSFQEIQNPDDPRLEPGQIAPRLEGLGDYSRSITTESAEAQAFFDQGLKLLYAFNHREALRAFREAERRDPNCSMAYWGQAMALGPNINAPMTRENELRAIEAVEEAENRVQSPDSVEARLIDNLSERYSRDEGADRTFLDRKYADLMSESAQDFPDDPDVLTLYAAALMNVRPWDYYTRDGRPRADTLDIVETLESVIEIAPDHPGALHYYIHAVEASTTPERALDAADRLAELMPGAGHLVHMPSHIYIRTGRYQDAVIANRKAIEADEDYIAQCRAQGIYPLGYYPHNIHFLWASLMIEGRSTEAIEAAAKVASRLPDEAMLDPENPLGGMLQLFKSCPMVTNVRFKDWEAALAVPLPNERLTLLRGIWHYSRGLAYVGLGRLDQADAEFEALRSLAVSEDAQQMLTWNYNSFGDLLSIAAAVLDGKRHAARGDFDQAIALLETGVRLEDALRYTEPPDWYFPVRQALGAVLLEAGRADEAETVFWEDLKRNPETGWALHGLYQSLIAQEKRSDADEVWERFQRVWERADFQLGLENNN